jgi:hypothetical protein
LENAASAKHVVNANVGNEEDFTGSSFLKSSVLRLKSTGSAIYRANKASARGATRQNQFIEFVFDYIDEKQLGENAPAWKLERQTPLTKSPLHRSLLALAAKK